MPVRKSIRLFDENGLSTITPNTVVNYVLLASSSGKYGGPFDTSVGQCTLVEDRGAVLVAGEFKNDEPKSISVPHRLHYVRHLARQKTFIDVTSWHQVVELWMAASAKVMHISFARSVGPLLALALGRVRGSKLVLQPHGMLTSRITFMHQLLDFLVIKPLIPRSAKVVALTTQEANELIDWLPRLEPQIRVIGNPTLNPRKTRRAEGTSNSALFVARLHSRKRVMIFADASKAALENNWPERYAVLGPDEGDLQELLRRTSRQPNFSYLGATDTAGVIDALENCGVFVLTSVREPWGNVLVTAIALGKPVVVTASSALAAVVAESKCGIVVPDEDPIAVALAVHEILEPINYDLFKKNCATAYTEHFSNKIVAQKLHAVYDEE